MEKNQNHKQNNWVAIVDLGSQYTHLIARRIRELGIFSEVVNYKIPVEELIRRKPRAIILSGGPASVTSEGFCECSKKVFDLDIPVLGICYGAHLMAKLLGGKVEKAKAREYGKAKLYIKKESNLFKGISSGKTVWMSHGDRISKLPEGFRIIASTQNAPVSAMCHKKNKLYGVQFHPEVVHTQCGKRLLKNFLTKISGIKRTWSMEHFIQEGVRQVRNQVGDERVLCALSGGVDSSVLAVFLHKAIGKNLKCMFIDNGLLRKDEAKIVKQRFKEYYHMDVRLINARSLFLKSLKSVVNPEKKRKIIGKVFIDVFEKEAKKISRSVKGKNAGRIKFLAQGTLYPDVIESYSPWGGPSVTIKTHHNVGGLPKRLNFELIEPFKFLFKDEVRKLGKELGLPDKIVYRHPFPGPGLGVRVLGCISKKRLDVLRQADWILIDEIKKAGLYNKMWQAFCVLLPVNTVGVMGDERTYENAVAIRAVTSKDAMTAGWFKFSSSFLEKVSNRIINEVKGVNRVVYDISSKPPSTIEWE
jgi:GMP synthase (glutamine-hydrolysing)